MSDAVKVAVAILLCQFSCGCTWMALGVNNAQHMTVERTTTPRIEKRFRVLDAETREPVPRAELAVSHNFDWMDDWVMNGITDADGLVTFKLAKEYLHLVRALVSARGYLTRGTLHFSDTREPGVGSISDDPVDIFIYRAPDPSMGVRMPEGYVGSFVYRLGATKYNFPFPPSFPAGQRIWWSELQPNLDEIVVEQPPPLGGSGWNGIPVTSFARGGEALAVPEPGAEVEGIAAWYIGGRSRKGPWGGTGYLIVVGDRAAALATAQEEWERHGNGNDGVIYNGWLKILSPHTKLSRGGAYSVTRPSRKR